MPLLARHFVFLTAFALSLVPATAQNPIKYTSVYPGTKFVLPVYFGSFPGRVKTNVVLEQHAGNVLLVYINDDNSVEVDTLYHLEVNTAEEMGLLGIAFHPDFNANRKYYISYNPPGTKFYDIVEERIADPTGMKDSGVKGRILFNIADPFENHNGGTLEFGPKDGYLYYGIGDGGSANDPNGNAQNLNSWLGKMHRIDVNSKDPSLEYHIPADNPFAKGGGRPEIFAYGLRNPWKWSFDSETGALWVGDVGQNEMEEVDTITKGGNYGWKQMEGPLGTNNGKMIEPLFSYNHSTGVSVIGGYVYRANPDAKYYGTYFVTDIGSSRMWTLKANPAGGFTATMVGVTPTGFSSFGVDAEGKIYGCGHTNGNIYRLDSPDFGTSAAVKSGPFKGAYGRSFTAKADGQLNPLAFSKSPVLEVFNLTGSRLGAIRRDHPRLPRDMEKGTYLLKPIPGPELPNLLILQ